jgi:hypothetical protein
VTNVGSAPRVSVVGERSVAIARIGLSPIVVVGHGASASGTRCDRVEYPSIVVGRGASTSGTRRDRAVPSIAKALAKGCRILRVIVVGERSDARPKIQLSPSVGVGRGASTGGTKCDRTKCDRTKCDRAIPVDVVVVVVVVVEMDVLAEMGVEGGSRWLESL